MTTTSVSSTKMTSQKCRIWTNCILEKSDSSISRNIQISFLANSMYNDDGFFYVHTKMLHFKLWNIMLANRVIYGLKFFFLKKNIYSPHLRFSE